MTELSLWKLDQQPQEDSLKQNIKTDVLIVGGGLTGINTAFQLRNSPYKITVVDQGQCGHGVTMRSTAKLTYLQQDQYSKIQKCYGTKVAGAYIASQKEAIRLAKEIIETHHIDCDFTKVDSYLFVTQKENLSKLKQEQKGLAQWQKLEDASILPINFDIISAFKVKDTYVFHPLKYLVALKELCKKKNIQFYEHTMVQNIKRQTSKNYIVKTSGGTITAKHVVICCHYPFFLIPFFIPFKTYLEKSYIGAFPVEQVQNFSAINLDSDTYSFRYHQDQEKAYFIYLSESHRLSDEVNGVQKMKNLDQKIQHDFRQKAEYRWSNYDLMTNDSLPFIGRINQKHPQLYLATGYNTWGMTNSILAGKIIADLIMGIDNPYVSLFQPDRKWTTSKIVNDLIDNFLMAKIFIQTKIKKNYSFYPKNVKVEVRNGKSCGIYIDDKGVEHVVSNLCPHMFCSLVFNPTTMTWDCPCHGSRFDIDGNVLKGPSHKDIKL